MNPGCFAIKPDNILDIGRAEAQCVASAPTGTPPPRAATTRGVA